MHCKYIVSAFLKTILRPLSKVSVPDTMLAATLLPAILLNSVATCSHLLHLKTNNLFYYTPTKEPGWSEPLPWIEHGSVTMKTRSLRINICFLESDKLIERLRTCVYIHVNVHTDVFSVCLQPLLLLIKI